ncbi:MAG: patatin-like phospholipase family protein [Candidatus Berkiella sp.]
MANNVTPIPLLIARAKQYPIDPSLNESAQILIAKAQANDPHRYALSEQEKRYLSHEWEYQDECKKSALPKPTGQLRSLLKDVTEVFIAGGGGAGRALPSAINEATEFGLDLKKLKVVCASSVGAIVGLGIAIGMPANRMGKVLNDMPTDTFQDWNWYSFVNFFTHWGWCQGETMPNYFKKMIRDETGLEDPTFLELYKAGYRKEFRVITANVSKQRAAIFSYLKTPHEKVAKAVGLACSIPFVFPPHWVKNEKGELEAYTDGGLANNYPWGVGSSPSVPLHEQLGFIIINNYGRSQPNENTLASFWHYLRGLIVLLFSKDPLCLPANQKERTVALTVNHNPLNFNASAKEQEELDEAGKIGVRRFARHLVKNKPELTKSSVLLPSFEALRHQNNMPVKPVVSPISTLRMRR